MVLPLYLAMNPSEFRSQRLPEKWGWMACHFSPWGPGISNIPEALPPGGMLILNDRLPCQGHSADLAAAQILEAVSRLDCESILLDFQRPDSEETALVASAIVRQASVPVAVSELYAQPLSCPVFLSPAPLHIPLADHLGPWKGREIWLEAALEQETVAVTKEGISVSSCFPAEGLTDGFYDESLHCCYHTRIFPEAVEFMLFDTMDSLPKKLELAHALGVTRAVGLYQELYGLS